jgi:AcrR family transcriptional regulator
MGTAERRKREKGLRSAQIQDAARKLFAKKGFHSTTMQGIAREAELSIGTIYFYFKTKEEIYASINLKTLESCDRGLGDLLRRGELSPEAKLQDAWELLHKVFCASPLSMRAFAHGQLQGSIQNISRDMLDALNRTGRRVLGKLASIFREGIDAGIFLEANPTSLADLLWSAFAGVVYWEEAKRTTDPKKNYLGPMLDLALKTFIRGIQKAKA